MTAFSFDLVTPERVLWSGEAEAVAMRTDAGDIMFLANYTPTVAALDITVLRIKPSSGPSEDGSAGSAGSSAGAGNGTGDGAGGGAAGAGAGAGEDGGPEIRAAVHGGFVHVDANTVVIAAPVAELASEIDVARAHRAFEAATERLAEEAAEGPPAAGGREAAAGAGAGGAGEGGEEHAAEPRPQGGGAFFDPASADAALRRAKVRLEAAGETVESTGSPT